MIGEKKTERNNTLCTIQIYNLYLRIFCARMTVQFLKSARETLTADLALNPIDMPQYSPCQVAKEYKNKLLLKFSLSKFFGSAVFGMKSRRKIRSVAPRRPRGGVDRLDAEMGRVRRYAIDIYEIRPQSAQ